MWAGHASLLPGPGAEEWGVRRWGVHVWNHQIHRHTPQYF